MENTNKRIAILLAGGTGTRMGHKLPKQYIEVEGSPIISYTLIPFIESKLFDVIIICADSQWRDYINSNLPEETREISFVFSNPGETRQLTIYNALKLIAEKYPDCEDVTIHDSARPLLTPELIKRCVDGLSKADGVLPVVKVKDTIYQSFDGKRVDSLLDRSTLYGGQSPESFRFPQYYDAHLTSSIEELKKINGSSELALQKGMKVDMIEGEENNFKITTPEDLERFKQILREKK